jgi:hypothetical protein
MYAGMRSSGAVQQRQPLCVLQRGRVQVQKQRLMPLGPGRQHGGSGSAVRPHRAGRPAAAAASRATAERAPPPHLERLLTSRAYTAEPYVGPIEVRAIPGEMRGCWGQHSALP